MRTTGRLLRRLVLAWRAVLWLNQQSLAALRCSYLARRQTSLLVAVRLAPSGRDDRGHRGVVVDAPLHPDYRENLDLPETPHRLLAVWPSPLGS